MPFIPPEYYARVYLPLNFMVTALANRVVFNETTYIVDILDKYPILKVVIVYVMTYTYVLRTEPAIIIAFLFFLYMHYKEETTVCKRIDPANLY